MMLALPFLTGILLLVSSYTTTFLPENNLSTDQKIQWLSWEEAVELNKNEPRKIFVDVYTDWCGWCKRMDQTTFQDPEIVKEISENFYAVKLDGEHKEDIIFQDHTFSFVKSGRKGYHQLAQSLLNGRLGYPSFVLLDESFGRIMISPGYKQPEQLMKELQFAKNEVYKEKSFEEFQKGS